MALWHALIDALGTVLRFFHDVVDPLPLFGIASWGWAIILLTFAVRLLLLPLAIKQINSMRAMQQLQPEIKKLQSKYKTDRSMMKTDPAKYRDKRQKQQEEMMKLYKEHNVNPAASCLPLLAQMPVFFALFTLLRDTTRITELDAAGFYIIASLQDFPRDAGPGAWILVLLMGLTTFWSQKQMMASNPAAAEMPQQKIMLYVMPVMLVVFAFNMPVGVLLYWVTTNFWTMGQQWFMFRNIEPAPGARA
jgi:YidC/Oxa1 family membrane protein insertase